MSTYELGQTITFVVQVTDDAGAAADLGGGDPTCTVTRPDGTTATATVTRKSAGLYWGSIASTTAGRWRGTFTGTGTNSGKLPFTDVADVWPADPRLIISLADAKAALQFSSAGYETSVNDDELRLYIAAATPVIENIVGRVLVATVTQTFDGGKTAVLLADRASAITSVTVDGVATTAYVANLDSGIVYAGTSSSPTTFTAGRQNVVVTYTVGGSALDPNIVLAARELVAAQYQTGQLAQHPAFDDGSAPVTVPTASGFAVPPRVLELCQASSHRRMPGFA